MTPKSISRTIITLSLTLLLCLPNPGGSSLLLAEDNVPSNNPGLRDSTGIPHPTPIPHPVYGQTWTVAADLTDSATDDRPAIEAALYAAQPGDEVYLPNGVYNLITPASEDSLVNIILKTGVNLRGESQTGVILKSYFDTHGDDGVENLEDVEYTVIQGLGKSDIRISDLTITSTFNRDFSSNRNLKNPAAGGPLYSIYLDQTPQTVPTHHVTIDHVTIERYRKSGIWIANTHDVVVTNSTVSLATDVSGGGAGFGICIQGRGHDSNYIELENDSTFNVVDSCTFNGPYLRHGVLMQYSTHNNLIHNNVFDGTQLNAIDCHGEDEFDNEVCYNSIRNSPNEAAIGLGNGGANHDLTGPGNWIHHNTMTNCKYGITVYYGTAETVIADNEIKDYSLANGAGIIIGNAPETIVRNNLIHHYTGRNAVGIKLILDSGAKWDTDSSYHYGGAPLDVQLLDNYIHDNSAGVRIEAGTCLESGNQIEGNGVDYYHY